MQEATETKEYLDAKKEMVEFKDIDAEIVYKLIDRALRGVFGAGEDAKKFIVANRIPFICHDIDIIKTNIKEIKDSLKENAEVIKTGFKTYDIEIQKMKEEHIYFKNDIDKLKEYEGSEEKSKQRREDWKWGLKEKAIVFGAGTLFTGAVFILQLVLTRLGILNLH